MRMKYVNYVELLDDWGQTDRHDRQLCINGLCAKADGVIPPLQLSTFIKPSAFSKKNRSSFSPEMDHAPPERRGRQKCFFERYIHIRHDFSIS